MLYYRRQRGYVMKLAMLFMCFLMFVPVCSAREGYPISEETLQELFQARNGIIAFRKDLQTMWDTLPQTSPDRSQQVDAVLQRIIIDTDSIVDITNTVLLVIKIEVIHGEAHQDNPEAVQVIQLYCANMSEAMDGMREKAKNNLLILKDTLALGGAIVNQYEKYIEHLGKVTGVLGKISQELTNVRRERAA